MKKNVTLFMLLCWACYAKAQTNSGKISGSVTDSLQGKPVPYVTIALKEADKLVTGTTADVNGAFELVNLPPGNFMLELTFIGYQTKKIKVNLTAAQPRMC